ncbi:MAG: PEGA domain-containing protein [Candidatus Cloacimonetes bacterium]|nr:PEGA domain-containing protein [Candidatus Cloacimonadota bacterium]
MKIIKLPIILGLMTLLTTPAWTTNKWAAFRIETDPQGATVTVIGTNQYLGTTPTESHAITIDQQLGYYGYTMGKWYDLIIHKAGYYDQVRRIFVPFNERYEDYALKRPQVFKFVLQPITMFFVPPPSFHFPYVPPSNWNPFYTSNIDVSSDPSNASVYIDDEYCGQTPCSVELIWDNYSYKKKTLRVEKTGYKMQQRVLESFEHRVHIVMQPNNRRGY